ncbi:hypothetical protein LA080_015264 [Diaporthe eres]|nr:hypothetical protein LA080_015264 [Diaporthe eres]
MAQLISDTQRSRSVGKSLSSYECVETHYDPGQPEVEVEAADSLSTTPSKLTTTLLKCQDYKPTALRWWFHGFLIICLATFLGLTEYAIQTLLANNQGDLVSQLLSRSINDHSGDYQSVPEQEEWSFPRLARVPSNATSSQAGAYSVNTGDFLPLGSSTSTIEVFTDSVFASFTTSHPVSQTTVPTGSSTTIPSFTETTRGVTSTTSFTTDGYLNLGTTTTTTFTIRSTTPGVGTTGGGFEITVPFPPSPRPEAGGTSVSDGDEPTYINGGSSSGGEVTRITMSLTSAYLNTGSTSLTEAPVPTLPPPATTDGGYLSLGVTTATVADTPDPTSPAATSPKVAGVVPDSDQKPVVTVIRQTESWPSSKATLQRTTTDSRGNVFVQTITTDVPAGTSVLETTVTMRPGESLVAVPKMITTTRGGLTQVMQTTYVDSEGRITTSSYTTVIGGESDLATQTFFVATSLPPGYTVITVQTAVPTTEGGTVEVVPTVYTDAQGRLTTSLYTRTVNGTPTLRTVPVVIATPASPGDKLVTLSTVVPTTIGGTTKVIKTTSTDSLGRPTTFSYTTVEGGTPTSTTVWTVVPTPTSTSATNSNGTHGTEGVAVVVYGLGLRDYILGAFLPTILAAVIAYPFKLINVNARLMQPFHELAAARGVGGVSAEASIFLRFYSWTGALSMPRSVSLRQPVIVISGLLVFGAALLAPIAAETVSVHVPDGCDLGCYGSVGVTTIPSRVLEALMAIMMVLLVALIVILNVFRWETGVSHNPWGIAGMASLGLNPEIREKIRNIHCDSSGSIKENMILKALAGSKYALDEYWVSSSPGAVSTRGYGIVVRTSNDDEKKLVQISSPGNGKTSGPSNAKEKKNTQPFALLTWWGRCILLLIFACVLIIATYYETTSLDSGFERFMDSRGFGIRFLFTALGVVIGGCMETFFRSVAIMLPYQQLSKYALPAERSILLSPPTNSFYGTYSAFRRRSFFLGAVAFTTILAELFLPVTLSHVPFSHLDTYETQLVCAWLSISILALMVLVILYSFLVRWPHMPVDPRTIAGAMFYVCDSWMLGTMEGMATVGKKEMNSIMRPQRLRYEFASSEGVNGKERMSVDICGETGEAAVMIRGEKAR